MDENKEAGKKGGGIARKARRELEAKTGRKVVTGENFLPLGTKKTQLEQIEEPVDKKERPKKKS